MAAVMDGLKDGIVSRLGMDMFVEKTEREESSESRDRRGERKEKRGIKKGRGCFSVFLPCLWRTYVS